MADENTKSAQHWADELKRYKDDYREKFDRRGAEIVKRFRDDRKDNESGEAHFNVFWSNVKTLKPAIFAKVPKPEVSRRFNDKDPVARTAVQILERSLDYEISQYPDYYASLSAVVDDRLLPGRGVAWVRYEPTIESIEQEPSIYEDAEIGEQEPLETITNEQTIVDYVAWRDFAHEPVRTWEEVNWVARRVYLSREEVVERFGKEFAQVPLTNQPKDENKTEAEKNALAKAEVWEIWCKSSKAVYWLCSGYDKLLDERQDPLEIEGFFPCPKPLYATLTTDSLIPVPDYALYQDQAKELDEITNRIKLLTTSLKVMGIYASDEPALQRLLKEGRDSEMLPVTNWPAFAERGGIKGAMEFMPLGDIIAALQELYRNRESCKQIIYEITGLSDIVRGASVASETATAQQIKSQFASIRLSEMKNDVARFAREIIRIKAEIMCSKYQPQTLVQASGILSTQDAQFAEQAIMLLKNEPLRNFTIDIESDSLVELDQQQEKQDRIEFLTAASGFIEKAVSAAMQAPSLAPLLGEMMLFGIRGFKVGQQLEGAFEQAIEQMKQPQQPQGPSPEQQQAQAEAQAKQAELQQAQAIEQMKMQNEQALEQMRIQANAQIEGQKLILEKWKVELQESTKLAIAQVSAQQAQDNVGVIE